MKFTLPIRSMCNMSSLYICWNVTIFEKDEYFIHQRLLTITNHLVSWSKVPNICTTRYDPQIKKIFLSGIG